MDDWQLVQAYAKSRSEAAFAELVRRHLDWVHSVAVRHVGDPHLAEDVTQAVFVLLARKAGELRPGTVLGGWLFRTTLHVASHARRAEQRRKIRETTACSMIPNTTSPETDELLWQQLVPHLDLAVAALSEADRSAILLRFYEKAPLGKVGEKLGVSEEAAKKRVSRAVERMREFLVKRGVKLGGVVLAALLAEKTVQAAPASMAGTVVKVSVAAASAPAAAMLPHLARETLKAGQRATIQLTAGIAASSLAVILMVASAGGLFNHHALSPSVAVNGGNKITPARDAQSISALPVNHPSTMAVKMGKITGRVMDKKGRPIAGAKVWSGHSSAPAAQDTTDQSGRFALNQIDGPPFVTVTADGFAADQQEFDPSNLPGPLIFYLAAVRPLQVRLVDESGRGVAGVRLFLSRWWGRAGTLAQHLPQTTDADGLLAWPSPPKGELELEFAMPGYRFSRTNKITADDVVHVIVLHPVATVTGRVTDANTGSPVPSFQYTIGHSQPWMPSDPVPMWVFHSHPASNGFYQMVIEEEQVPFLRIEADGYETVETAIQLTNGVAGVRDFQLNPGSAAHSIQGIVLLPDGTPAAGVEVALCTSQVGVMLKGTAFAPGAFGNIPKAQMPDYRRKTDEQGSFLFPPKPGAHTVVAVGLAGLGQIRCFDFSKPLEIRLQPWGRIEGTVRTRDGQRTGRTVQWQRPGPLTSWKTLFYQAEGFSTRSAAAGKFTLEHVPPGDGRLETDDGPGTALILSPSIEVNPGATVTAQIGGEGRPVTGKLVAPPEIEIRNWSDQVTFAELHVEWDRYPLPKELTGNAVERWKLEYEDTAAGRAWFRAQWSYDFKVGADGSFILPEVLPGKYRLFVNVAQGNLGSGRGTKPSQPGDTQIAYAGMKFEVPEVSGDGGSAVDLGEIILSATH